MIYVCWLMRVRCLSFVYCLVVGGWCLLVDARLSLVVGCLLWVGGC